MPLSVTTLGFIAACLTTAAFFPQVLHTWKTGGRDLSWSMLSLFGTGVALWLLYGILLGVGPIILANALTVTQIALIVYFKWSRSSDDSLE